MHTGSFHFKARGSEIQGHPSLLSEFEANLGYMRSYLKDGTKINV